MAQIKDLTTTDTFGGLSIKSITLNDDKYTIVLNGKLTELKKEYFDTEESLTEFTVPNSINTIDDDAFSNCENLLILNMINAKTSTIESTNPNIISGTIMLPKDSNGNTLVLGKTYTIPNSTAELEELFTNHESINTHCTLNIMYGQYFYGQVYNNQPWKYPVSNSNYDNDGSWYLQSSTGVVDFSSIGEREIWIYCEGTTLFDGVISEGELSDYTLSSTVEGSDSSIVSRTLQGVYSYSGTNGLYKVKFKEDYTVDQLKYLFVGEKGIKAVAVGSGITELGEGMFRECENLKWVMLPDTVTTIGNYCFYACLKLEVIRLSNNLTVIPDYCFFADVALSIYNMPTSLTTINQYAFAQCNIGNTQLCPFYDNPSETNVFGENAVLDTYGRLNYTILEWPASLSLIKNYAFWKANFSYNAVKLNNTSSLPTAELYAFDSIVRKTSPSIVDWDGTGDYSDTSTYKTVVSSTAFWWVIEDTLASTIITNASDTSYSSGEDGSEFDDSGYYFEETDGWYKFRTTLTKVNSTYNIYTKYSYFCKKSDAYYSYGLPICPGVAGENEEP